MRYSVINLGQAEPARYVPVGPAECTNSGEYRKGVDNAAARIAFYQDAAQQAAQTGNDQAVSRAAAGSDLANRDWSAWSDVLKKCGQGALAPGASSGGGPGLWFPILGTVVLVGIFALEFTPVRASWARSSKKKK